MLDLDTPRLEPEHVLLRRRLERLCDELTRLKAHFNEVGASHWDDTIEAMGNDLARIWEEK